MQITPRESQKEAVLRPVIQALKKRRKALLVMATGLGKTIASALVAKSFNRFPVIFLAHNNDILMKAVQDYRLIFPELRFGIFNGEEKNAWDIDIVFASVQAVQRNLVLFGRKRFKLLILDESHHAPAKTFNKVIEHFKCPRLGITATPDRMDLKDIRTVFGSEIVNILLEEAVVRGWLPDIDYKQMADNSLNEVYLRDIAKRVLQNGERIPIEQIKKRLFVKAREERIASIVDSYGQKAVVFCKNIKRANEFAKLFKGSAVYHSNQDPKKNTKALEDLRAGRIRAICAVNSFNEGIDVPDVGLVVFARSTQSETVFRQQLGRGMRPGKKKLIVLDFVGNVERILMLNKIKRRIEELQDEGCFPRQSRNSFIVSGKGYEFSFSKEIVDIIEVLKRLKVEFYPTWEEASEAVRKLKIKTAKEYRNDKRYQEDSRLPSNPNITYPNYPGDLMFFRGEFKPDFCPTWREAAEVASKLEIKHSLEYKKRYREDPKLPSNPNVIYDDFPGWKKFLGTSKRFYPTWQAASRAIKKHHYQSQREYYRHYREDPRLPSNPQRRYSDFPGWGVFLRGEGTEPFYPKLSQASRAARRSKLRTKEEYKNNYKKDPRLPSSPNIEYEDFPGWPIFLRGRKRPSIYKSLEKARRAARGLGLETKEEYMSGYKKDPHLPSMPQRQYNNFPGWPAFLGR